jgi:hypothetical protein
VNRDTSAEAENIQADIVRRLGPDRRLRMAIAMSEDLRSMAMQRLRQQHPEFDEAALRRALIEELYGIRIGRG